MLIRKIFFKKAFCNISKLFSKRTEIGLKSQNHIQESISENVIAENKIRFFPNTQNQEIINIKKNLYLQLNQVGLRKLDYNQIYEELIKLISKFNIKSNSLTPSNFDDILLIFLEKNIQMFSIKQMIEIMTNLGKANIGNIATFNAFQHHLNLKLLSEKHLICKKLTDENLQMTKLLFYYFSTISELSFMEIGPLNFIIEYFSNHSNILFCDDKDTNALSNLYNFIWFTSISLASILEKRKCNDLIVDYIDTESQVLNEKAARGFIKILNHADGTVSSGSFSENTNSKVRLYKSLHYLKADGVELPKNLEDFLVKFQPFYQMNIEASTSSSSLENSTEKILKKLNIPYEREKKLPFCSVDFFIKPHVCLEVNGPHHYVLDTDLLLARDLMKIRLLKLNNYEIINIHFSDLLENKLGELSARLNHLKSFEVDNEVTNLIDPEYLEQKNIERAGEKVLKRIKNAQYLI